MTVRPNELIEFHRQLSLLLNSDLPLPDSLENLAKECAGPELKEALAGLAARTAEGVPLAQAMEHYPRLFPPLHARLVLAGEEAGTLAEALNEVAEVARLDLDLSDQLRAVVGYPLFVGFVAVAVFLAMMRFVVHAFGQVFCELLEMVEPPLFSMAVFAVADVVITLWLPLMILYCAGVGFVVWLFCSAAQARRALRGLIALLPGVRPIVLHLDAARLCGMWSLLARRQTPSEDILKVTAAMTEDAAMRAELESIQGRCERGTSLHQCMDEAECVPGPVRLALCHTPAAELPNQLTSIKSFHTEAASGAIRAMKSVWEVSAMLLMGVVVAAVVMSLFVPLIQLNRNMLGAL